MKRILIIMAIINFVSLTIYSQSIPKQISYQGVLKNAAGVNVADGNYSIVFKIYNEPTGGTPLWTESQSITVKNGFFSAQLGSVLPITSVPFDRLHFLGITVGTGTELTPRTMLTPSPYSFMSMNIEDEVVTTTKIRDGAVTGDKIGSNQVVKSINGLKDDVNFLAGTNILLTPSGNNITISAAGGGGGGTVTQVNTGAGLTGGPITTTGTISVANEGITSVMLQNNSVTTDKIVDGTISTNDLANNSVTSIKIADGTIVTSDLSDNSVTTAKVVDGTITATDIGSTQVVKSLNAIKDNVNLVAGTNITITPSGQNITIASTSGGMGGSGTTNYIPLFTGTTTLGNSAIYQTGGNIGFGTTTPTTKLHISGTSPILRIADGMQATGKILVSDANGNASWQDNSFYHTSGNLNTSSVNLTSTWTSMGNFLTFTKNSASSTIEVHLNSRVTGGTFSGATGVWFEIRIDGVAATLDNKGSIRTSGESEFISIFAVFTNLSAGSHTVSVWAKTNAGTSTNALLDPGGWGGRIIVKETF